MKPHSMSVVRELFPCKKKPRRSSRLEIKEKFASQNMTIDIGPLGYFEILPLELKFQLLTYLSIEDLSILSIVSKSLRNVVEVYKGTSLGQDYLSPSYKPHDKIPYDMQEQYLSHYERLGLLMKRSTCLYATRDRLKFLQLDMHKFVCSQQKCEEYATCVALTCYGKFLHTVIAGWDDKECLKAFEMVNHTSSMMRNLNSIVKCKPGAYSELELQTRIFYRRVFFKVSVSSTDHAFWLNLILQRFPMVHQARIIFLLFGPMCGNEIQWYEMCENTPGSREQAKVCFGELAIAFKTLHHHAKQWTEDDIISVIDEITSSPDDWLAENVANLLYLCGDGITLRVLHSKAINGRMTELASIITSLCLVCTRHDTNLTWVMKLVTSVCSVLDNSRDKLSFLYSIVDMFREVVLDIHEFAEAEDEGSTELQYMLDAQSEFMKELVLMAFQKVLLP